MIQSLNSGSPRVPSSNGPTNLIMEFDKKGLNRELEASNESDEKHYSDQTDPAQEPASAGQTLSDYPEGSTRGWLVLVASCCIMAMSFGMVNSYGVYQSYYEVHYPHISSNTLSIIGSLQACLTFAVAIPSTIIMYYVGPQMVVLMGGVIACLSYFMLSLQNAVWQLFIIQGLMFGLGSGLMYVHATSVLFQYFHKKKALVQGLITASASTAGVYWPIGVRELINKVGFKWANRIIGFIYLPLFIVATLLIRPRVKPPKRQPGQNFLRISFKVLLDSKFCLVALCWFLFILSLFPGLFYIDLFCMRIGVAKGLRDYNVAIINASACFGRIIPGYYADKYGRINIIIPFLFISGIFPLVLWTTVRNTSGVAAFCVIWGFFSGTPVSVMPSIVGQLFPAEDMSSYLSFFFACGGIGSLVGPIIAGTFIPKGDVEGAAGFNKLAIFSGVIEIACAGIMIIVRSMYTRNLIKKI